MCVRKSLVATCSTDKTVRVWNYLEKNLNLENFKQFEEEACALAFHPSGFHLVVAFTDKIRMLNIFEKDILPYKEINIKVNYITNIYLVNPNNHLHNYNY